MARGEVKYRVVLDSKDVERGIAAIRAEFKALGDQISGSLGRGANVLGAMGPAGAAAAVGVGALVGAVTLAGKAVADAVAHFAAWSDELSELSAKTGISVEGLQSLNFAAKLTGTSVQDVAGAVNKLQKAMVDGNKGFATLGLSAQKLRAMNPEDAFLKVAEAIRGLPSATEQAAAAMQLFGRSGATLLPAINEGLAEAAKRAKELGIVLSGEDVAAAAALQDQIDTLGMAWEALKNRVAAIVIESGAAQSVFGTLLEIFASLSHWIKQNEADLKLFASVFGTVVTMAVRFTAALDRLVLTMAKKMFRAGSGTVGAFLAGGPLGGVADAFAGLVGTSPTPSGGGGGPMGPPVPAGLADRNKRAAKAADEVQKLADKLSGKEAQDQANKLTAAFKLQREAIEGNAAGFNRFIDELAKAREEGAQLTPEMLALTDSMLELRRAAGEGGVGPPMSGASFNVGALIKGADRSLMGGGLHRELDLSTAFNVPAQQTHKIVRETDDWSSALNDVANAFQVLGVKSDSVFGRVLGGLTAGGASLDRFQKLLTIKDETTGKSKFSLRNLGTGGLGSVLGQASAAMGIAGAAVSVGKAIAGLFGSSPVEKATKTAGKVLGVKVSEELAQSIVDTAKKHNVSTAIASLLNLSGAITASGKDPRGFSAQVGDLMNAVKLGAAPAREGLAEIGKAFGQIADSALKSGVVGDRALVGLIKRAKELGQEIPEIKAFVGEQLTSAAQGITDLVTGMAPTTEAGAAAQATLFSGVFWATLKEKGLVAAADALGPALKTLEEQLASAGIDMPKGFAEVAGLVNLGQNEQVRGASQAAAGAGAALSGMANAGFLSADMLAATGQIAADAVKQAMAGGASEQQGLQLIAPLLSQLLSASQQSGMALDDQTQMLLKQAQDNGIALLQTPIEQQTRILGEIRDTLRGIAGMGREEGGASVPGAPLGAAVGVAQFQHGSGGVRDFGRGMPALLHGKEAILTEDQMRAMAGGVSVANKPNFVIDGGGRSDDHVVSLIVQALARNDGNIATAVERIIAGKR